MDLPFLSEIRATFQKHFEATPQLIVRSPGRINLIGEHTDYNGGYVLPAAIDREIIFAISPRTDRNCQLIAYNLGRSEIFSLDNLTKSEETWTYYLKGVIDEIQKLGHLLQGFNLVFGGNILTGAGISSSAALETGIALALNELFALKIDKIELVKICQRAENEFVGLKCGIMDMFASMMGKADSVLRLDCRSLEYQYFPFVQDKFSVILCDTGVKHSLASSEYNTRRQECENGVRILQTYYPDIQYLRDVSLEMLFKHQAEFDPITFKRCRYVVEEIERIIAACEDLQANDLEAFGQKMYATHEGLEKLYEVSCAELDFLVEQTRENPAVLGARMMGGGFGGCTINIVQKEKSTSFIQEMAEAYQKAFQIELVCHQVVIKDGTSILKN